MAKLFSRLKTDSQYPTCFVNIYSLVKCLSFSRSSRSEVFYKKDVLFFRGLHIVDVLSLSSQFKSRTPQYYRQRDIFNRTPNFASASSLATEQLLLSAAVVLSRKSQIPRQKHTSEHIFYGTVSSGCFCSSFG